MTKHMDPANQRVVLCRHGATEWSENGKHTSHTDLILTPQGEAEARRLRPLLVWWKFAKVFCSPLQRAKRTCELAGLVQQAEITEDLMEWDYGDYEGLTSVEISKNVPGWTIFSHPCPNGESADQVAERCDRVIDKIITSGGDCSVFAHGHVLRVFVARWLKLAPSEGRHFTLGTGTASMLGFEHNARTVLAWNAPVVSVDLE